MKNQPTYTCDRCGIHCGEKPTQVSIWTGWYSDPCEGQKRDTQHVDLCVLCAAWAFGQAAKAMTEEAGAKLISDIRSHLAKVKAESKARLGL
jgi:hypothetical protein